MRIAKVCFPLAATKLAAVVGISVVYLLAGCSQDHGPSETAAAEDAPSSHRTVVAAPPAPATPSVPATTPVPATPVVIPVAMKVPPATEAEVPENPVLTELVTKGVAMPDGQVVKLPPPTMGEGLNAKQQAAVLAKVAAEGRIDQERFMETSSGAPVFLRIGKIPSATGKDIIRTINLYFVLYGDWDVLTSDEFSNSILKKDQAKGKNQGETAVSKAGYMRAPELAVRRLSTHSTPSMKEYFLYTTIKLFDQAEFSATRFGVATKMPAGVVVAAAVDPRFAKDKEFPNQWRSITRNAAGIAQYGPLHPYSGAGFYAKVTRLIEPANAIFIEYHSAFYEPEGWFGSENSHLMPSELHKIIPFKVKEFRGKLARASLEAKKGKAESEKK